MMKAVPQNGVCSVAPVHTPSSSDNGNTPVSQTRALCLSHFSCFSSIRVRGNGHDHHLSSFGALTDLTLAHVPVLESGSEHGKGESSSNKQRASPERKYNPSWKQTAEVSYPDIPIRDL